MNKELSIRSSAAEFLIFETQAKEDSIEVRNEDNTLWLTQKMMAQLFSVESNTITYHLQDLFRSKEITEDSTEYKPNYERYKAFKGMTYKVKLVMSDEYIIEAHSKEESEKLARDRFGNNYLIDDVIITEME